MRFSVLTLFPEQIDQNVMASITGRALEKGLFSYKSLNVRDYADNRYGKVDDTICGGGTGMLMQCHPIKEAWLDAQKLYPNLKSRNIYLSPKGKKLEQGLVRDLAKEEHLILLCGHYEGIDVRVLEELQVEEISVGDYILTGGELAASILIDAVARLLPGVLPSESVYEEESHSAGLLECRHYTKPAVWNGRQVPDILLSGNHAAISKWRYLDALAETMEKTPQLFDKLQLDETTLAELVKHIKEER